MSEDIISIEDKTFEDVKSILNKDYFLKIDDMGKCMLMGMQIDILDLTQEYAYARRFLNENGLEEDNPFYKEFDMQNFNVIINICSEKDLASSTFRSIVAGQMGKHISLKLNTRVVIELESGDIPFCIYDKGVKIRDLKEYYKDYFKDKDWYPNVN